jgi:hypothetical protein
VQSLEDTVAESTDNTEATNPIDRPSLRSCAPQEHVLGLLFSVAPRN